MKKGPSRTIYVKSIMITPKMAMEWLENTTTKNRNVSQTVVNRYALTMEQHQWRADNGETIKIGKDNNVIDGQHRLWAVAQAEMSVRMLVAFNVADDSFDTIDQGKRRCGADMMSIKGVTNASVVAAALALVSKYEMSDISACGQPPTNTEMLELYKRHPGISDSASFFVSRCNGSWKRRMIPPSVIVFFHYILSLGAREQTEIFLISLVSGENLKRRSPVYLLHDRMMANMVSRVRMTKSCMLAFIVKAWNAHIQGRQIKALKWSIEERFPEIILKPKSTS